MESNNEKTFLSLNCLYYNWRHFFIPQVVNWTNVELSYFHLLEVEEVILIPGVVILNC